MLAERLDAQWQMRRARGARTLLGSAFQGDGSAHYRHMAAESGEEAMNGVTTYTVHSMWLGGGLTPASIGERLLSTFDHLGPLSRATSDWRVADPVV